MAGRTVKKSKKQTEYKTCTSCKKNLAITNFYQSSSIMFADKKTPICKTCLKNMVDYDDMDTIYSLLQTIDLPFIKHLWDSCEDKNEERTGQGRKYDIIGNYIRQISSLTQYKTMGWKNSEFDKPVTKSEEQNDDSKSISLEEKRRLKEEWGEEWKLEELKLLDKTFKELSADKNMKFNSSKQYMKLATMNYVRSYMAMREGNASEADKYTKLFNETMKMGEFNPSALAKNSNLEKLGSFSDFSLMVEECVDIVDIQKILPEYMEKPRDLADKVIWYVVNYMQDSQGYKMSSYEDIYKFYSQMEADFYGVPLGSIPKSSTLNDVLNINDDKDEEES